MTIYQSGAAFRRALEERLRSKSLQDGVPLFRLRKMVAFDRFLARLVKSQPERWLLKGGFSIQLQIIDKARTTKDLDILILSKTQDILMMLRQACEADLGDWFTFEVSLPEDQAIDNFGGSRYHIRSLLDSRIFEAFHIDVGIGDPVLDEAQRLTAPALLEFAEIQPAIIPCYPITQQIAEKIHAYTRAHRSSESSRVKDFVDILLLARIGMIDSGRLLKAIRATFEARNTHPIPSELPDPPHEWYRPYQKMAAEVDVGFRKLDAANLAVKKFIDPILGNEVIFQWDPDTWSWR
jgi:hypothetical protein